jgi:hypothetical protein
MTCRNNSATCRLKLGEWDDSATYRLKLGKWDETHKSSEAALFTVDALKKKHGLPTHTGTLSNRLE